VLGTVQGFSLSLLFFFLNFENWDPFGTAAYLSLPKVVGWLYAASVVANVPGYLRRGSTKPVLQPMWLLFILVTAQSALHASWTLAGVVDFTWLQNIVLLWLLLNHAARDPAGLERALVWFAVGAGVFAVLYFGGVAVETAEDGRVRLFGDNSNAIGLRQVMAMSIIVWSAVRNPAGLGKARFVLLPLLPVMLQLTAESGSRVAFLSLAIIAVAMVVAYRGRTWIGTVLVSLTLAGAAYGGWMAVVSSETMMRRLEKTVETGTLGGRDAIWGNLVPIVQEHPVFGVGETGFQEEWTRRYGTGVSSPHNVFLEVQIYAGVVGLILFVVFLSRVVKRALDVWRTERQMLPLLLLVPVAGTLMSGQVLAVKVMWCVFGYAAARAGRTSGTRSAVCTGPAH
jgi:O-antigen ligase